MTVKITISLKIPKHIKIVWNFLSLAGYLIPAGGCPGKQKNPANSITGFYSEILFFFYSATTSKSTSTSLPFPKSTLAL